MHWMLSFVIFVTYAFLCLGWGFLMIQVCGRFRIDLFTDKTFSDDSSILVVSGFLTGAAAISALLTVLGLIGQLRPLPLILVLLPGSVGLMLGRKILQDCMDASFDGLKAIREMPLWLLLITGFTALLTLGTGIGAWVLPPKGDAAAFYMVYPKIIAATGLLEPMHGPYYFFSVIGLPVELHYAALMVLADEHAAKFFMFPIAMSVGVMLAGIVRLCGGGIAAVAFSWAMLFSSYTFHHYVYDGKVDLAAAAFGLAAVYWLLRGTESRVSVLAFGVAGWFAGLATTAKFSYLLVLGVSLLVLLAWRLMVSRSEETKLGESSVNLARASGLMAITAVVAWFPQLLKNGMLFDAPLAPFWGGQGDGSMLSQVWFSPGETIKILLTYPFALVFGRYPMQGGGLSFLFLAFVPFLIWLSRPKSWRKSMTVAVTVAAFAGVMAWMVLRPSVIAPRYILATLLLFVPILAIAAEDVLTTMNVPRMLQMGTTAAVMLAIAASFWHLLPIVEATFTAQNARDNACRLAGVECRSFQQLKEVARPGDRILISSYYPYWLAPSHIQCRDSLQEQREIPDQAQLLPWLQSHGFAYVAIDTHIFGRLADDMAQLAISHSVEVQELPNEWALKLYRIKSETPGHVRCVESTPGRWYLQRDPL
jgi:hypothetical protein